MWALWALWALVAPLAASRGVSIRPGEYMARAGHFKAQIVIAEHPYVNGSYTIARKVRSSWARVWTGWMGLTGRLRARLIPSRPPPIHLPTHRSQPGTHGLVPHRRSLSLFVSWKQQNNLAYQEDCSSTSIVGPGHTFGRKAWNLRPISTSAASAYEIIASSKNVTCPRLLGSTSVHTLKLFSTQSRATKWTLQPLQPAEVAPAPAPAPAPEGENAEVRTLFDLIRLDST